MRFFSMDGVVVVKFAQGFYCIERAAGGGRRVFDVVVAASLLDRIDAAQCSISFC